MLEHDPDGADPDADDTADLTLDQRLTAVAVLLARGLLRQRQRRYLDRVSLQQIPSECPTNRLDVHSDKSVHAATPPVNRRREDREERSR